MHKAPISDVTWHERPLQNHLKIASHSTVVLYTKHVIHKYTILQVKESQLVTYAAGSVKSTVNYTIVWQEDKAKVCKVNVIPNEGCVPKHKLLAMDMQFNTIKIRHKKFEPTVHIWKLKEEKTCEEWSKIR